MKRTPLNTVILLLVITLAIGGCFARQSGTIIKDKEARILFIGNRSNAEVQIEGYKKISLTRTNSEYISVKPGTRRITVWKNNKIVVNKKIFLDDGVTMEVKIP